jgi:hypothetical protein
MPGNKIKFKQANPTAKTIYMKRALLHLLLPSFLFTSCNSDTNTVQKDESAKDTKVKAAAVVDPVTQKTEELKQLKPIGLDELSAWLPTVLNGIKRSNLTMSSDMGYTVAHADYEKNSKTDMRVTVYDCAGTSGAALYKTNYAGKFKDVQDEDGYTKTVNLSNGRAIEHHETKNKVTSLSFMTNDRILVVLSARNFEPEKVRAAAESLMSKK